MLTLSQRLNPLSCYEQSELNSDILTQIIDETMSKLNVDISTYNTKLATVLASYNISVIPKYASHSDKHNDKHSDSHIINNIITCAEGCKNLNISRRRVSIGDAIEIVNIVKDSIPGFGIDNLFVNMFYHSKRCEDCGGLSLDMAKQPRLMLTASDSGEFIWSADIEEPVEKVSLSSSAILNKGWVPPNGKYGGVHARIGTPLAYVDKKTLMISCRQDVTYFAGVFVPAIGCDIIEQNKELVDKLTLFGAVQVPLFINNPNSKFWMYETSVSWHLLAIPDNSSPLYDELVTLIHQIMVSDISKSIRTMYISRRNHNAFYLPVMRDRNNGKGVPYSIKPSFQSDDFIEGIKQALEVGASTSMAQTFGRNFKESYPMVRMVIQPGQQSTIEDLNKKKFVMTIYSNIKYNHHSSRGSQDRAYITTFESKVLSWNRDKCGSIRNLTVNPANDRYKGLQTSETDADIEIKFTNFIPQLPDSESIGMDVTTYRFLTSHINAYIGRMAGTVWSPVNTKPKLEIKKSGDDVEYTLFMYVRLSLIHI